MKNNHEIILKQYAAYCKEQPLYLGTAGSYGMEMLTIIREGVWAEYDILAAFHPPVGAAGAQPIPALSGTNTLLTDADSVSVSGRADLIRIIRKMQEK